MVYFQKALRFLIKYKFYFIVGVLITATAVIAFVTSGQSSAMPKEQITTTISASESETFSNEVIQTTNDSLKSSTSATKQKETLQTSQTTKSANNNSGTSVENSTVNAKSNTTATEKSEQVNKSQSSAGNNSNNSTSSNTNKTTKPVEQKETQKKESTCTIEINCSNILSNLDNFNSDKLDILPNNGIILDTQTVKISSGETVYDILQKACKQKSILIVSSYTPAYGSRYIKSIGNIGEFDCGVSSGWTYSVNGSFPSYSSSKFDVKDGDTIKWLYTCNNGKDVRNE